MINWNIPAVMLKAWAERLAACGRILVPGKDECEPFGYAHDDCVEVAFDGPVKIEPIEQGAFFKGEYAPRDSDVVDTYYGVEPLGWTPMDDAQEVRAMWMFGPSYQEPLNE